MKLIDKGIAYNVLSEYYRHTGVLQYMALREALDRVPVVDAEPVRHGKWIEDGSFKYKHGGRNSDVKELFGTEWRTMRRIKCSLCNKITLVDETILYEYCPHCGAKMDGEKNGTD